MIKYTTNVVKPDTFEVERREVELPKLMVDTLLRSIELLPFIKSDDEYFVTPPMFSPDMSSITVGVLCNGKKFKMEISKAE